MGPFGLSQCPRNDPWLIAVASIAQYLSSNAIPPNLSSISNWLIICPTRQPSQANTITHYVALVMAERDHWSNRKTRPKVAARKGAIVPSGCWAGPAGAKSRHAREI